MRFIKWSHWLIGGAAVIVGLAHTVAVLFKHNSRSLPELLLIGLAIILPGIWMILSTRMRWGMSASAAALALS